MTSLSDLKPNGPGKSIPDNVPEEDDDFRPMNLSTLERFDTEVSLKTPETEPDFDRFKLLFDPSEFEQEGPVFFESIYHFTKDDKGAPFEPLIKGAGDDIPANPAEAATAEAEDREPEEIIPEKTPEEIGFEKGFEKGLAQGRVTGEAEGEAKGYEQGMALGQAQGEKKGEAEGFAKGEAEGFEKGYQEGLAKAQAEVSGETAQILEPLRQGLETVDQLMDRLVKRYEVQIIELVHRIAQRAVMAKLDTDDEVVKLTILDALKSLVAPERISLSVAAEDYEYVQMVKDEFFEAVRTLKNVAIASDSMIPRGGCRIETATATITTDPETKLAAIYDAMVRAGRS